MQMINAYRVRGHLIADLDPLGARAQLSSRARSGDLRPHHLGPGPRVPHRQPGRGHRRRRPQAGGHAARDSGDAAPDLLRQNRLRVHEHPGAGAEALAAAAHGAGRPTTGRWIGRRACAFCATCSPPRSSSISCTPASWARSVLRWKARETALAILEEILERAAANNVHEIVIGMAHRGRLNVLANVIGKDVKQIFSEFEGELDPSSTQGSGDVKYHLGAQRRARRPKADARSLVSVAPNPSHLEAVDPVVEGIVRPKQDRLGDTARERVIPLLIHGDAAFAGQGVVAETLNLSQLDGYSHRRHHSPDHQQPDRLHHAARRIALHALFHRRRARRAGAHFPRQRRRSRSRHPRGADRLRLPPAVQERRGDRHVLLPPPRPQRRRRPQLHAAAFSTARSKSTLRWPSCTRERLVREGVVSAEEVDAMRKSCRASGWPRPTTQPQKKAEHFELQELSAVPSEEIASFCPRTAVNQPGAGARDPRHHAFPGELPPASQAARLRRAAPRGHRQRRRPSTGRSAKRWPSARWRWKARRCG